MGGGGGVRIGFERGKKLGDLSGVVNKAGAYTVATLAKRDNGLDRVSPINGQAVDVGRRQAGQTVLPRMPIDVGPIDAGALRAFGGREMINLRHDGVAPETKFFVWKRRVQIDDRKGRMRQKFVRIV